MIFISYSLKDEAPFTSLCLALESTGLPYWDGRLKSGASLKEQLGDAISKCEVCIFIATKNSIVSPWCLNEIGAFWGAGKRIILYSADHDVELPPLFKGDYKISNAREVIRQVREEFEELAGEGTPKREAGVLIDEESSADSESKSAKRKRIRTLLSQEIAYNVKILKDTYDSVRAEQLKWEETFKPNGDGTWTSEGNPIQALGNFQPNTLSQKAWESQIAQAPSVLSQRELESVFSFYGHLNGLAKTQEQFLSYRGDHIGSLIDEVLRKMEAVLQEQPLL